MSNQTENPPAFPMPAGPEPRVNETTHYNEGMTLHDYFMAKAMQALIARDFERGADDQCHEVASASRNFADAILTARKQEGAQ